ncbi:hypothetical protein Golax_007437 [Gossypium laxum]|nr:hypothetical protein [Gossypium laxum]
MKLETSRMTEMKNLCN